MLNDIFTDVLEIAYGRYQKSTSLAFNVGIYSGNAMVKSRKYQQILNSF